MKKTNSVLNKPQIIGVILIIVGLTIGILAYVPNTGIGNYNLDCLKIPGLNRGAGTSTEQDSCAPATGGNGATCHSDADCKPSWGCDHGVCSHAGGDPSGACSSNSDCGGCQNCVAGACAWRCPSTSCHFVSCGTNCEGGKCPGESGY